MKKIQVKIEGVSPLLLHRFLMEEEDKKKAVRKDKIYDSVEDANKSLYKDEKIGCYVPSVMVEACIREASKDFKKGKINYKTTILSSVFVEEEKISLNKEIYDEIDKRPVVIQRNRIVRSRPRFNKWELSFILCFDENRIEPGILKQILEESGVSRGLGDYRPKFGRFKIIEYKPLD